MTVDPPADANADSDQLLARDPDCAWLYL